MIYVWLDALTNYMTAIGFGSDDPTDQQKLARYWPADVHMIGKEIVRFHCVYWPAFLLAADLPLPKSIIAHGWLLFEESKMSKSRGNIVRSETILDTLGGDALRYFLLREIVFGQDGSFSFDALVQRFNADLANELGNLSSRTLSMITRYFDGEVPYPSPASARRRTKAIGDLAQRDDRRLSRAVRAIPVLARAGDCLVSGSRRSNKYIVENEPWAVAEREDQDSRARLATILYTSAEALRIVTALVHPVIPEATARIWTQLGLGEISQLDLRTLAWGQLQLGTKLGKVEAVFPRADKSTIERMQQMEQQRSAESADKDAEPKRRVPEPPPAGNPAPRTQAQPSDRTGSPSSRAPSRCTTPAAVGERVADKDHHRRLPEGRVARRRGEGCREGEGRRQAAAPGSRYRHRGAADRRRNREGLRSGEADRTQGRDRRQSAAAQAARAGVERHDRRGVARRRRPAGAGGISGGCADRSEAEVVVSGSG